MGIMRPKPPGTGRRKKLVGLGARLDAIGVKMDPSIRHKGHQVAWADGYLTHHAGKECRSPYPGVGPIMAYHRAWVKGFNACPGAGTTQEEPGGEKDAGRK